MRFIVIYKDKDANVQSQLYKMLLSATQKGYDFSKEPVKAEFFETFLDWPTEEQIGKLSFSFQIEEIEINNNTLTSLRKRIIDAEIVENKESGK